MQYCLASAYHWARDVRDVFLQNARCVSCFLGRRYFLLPLLHNLLQFVEIASQFTGSLCGRRRNHIDDTVKQQAIKTKRIRSWNVKSGSCLLLFMDDIDVAGNGAIFIHLQAEPFLECAILRRMIFFITAIIWLEYSCWIPVWICLPIKSSFETRACFSSWFIQQFEGVCFVVLCNTIGLFVQNKIPKKWFHS